MFEGQPKGLYALALANTGERFGYYTMLAIFTLFLQAKFGYTATETSTIFASFLGFVYFMPLVGGILADKFGYGKMVTSGIVIMFLGYVLLAIPTAADFSGKAMMFGALALISCGTGLFKGNLQVLVGNLYDNPQLSSKRDTAFSLFYMAINIGALFAPTAATKITNYVLAGSNFTYEPQIPSLAHQFLDGTIKADGRVLLEQLKAAQGYAGDMTTFCTTYISELSRAYNYGFAVACVSLIVSMIIYLVFFARDYTAKSVVGLNRLGFDILNLVLIVVSVYSAFSLFQSKTTKGKTIAALVLAGAIIGIVANYSSLEAEIKILPQIFQQFNPFFVVALTPVSLAVFGYLGRKGKEPTAPRKIGYGMLIAACGFLVLAIASFGLPTPTEVKNSGISDSQLVSPDWLISTYLVLTFAELLLSPMGISFVSKVAPPKYKGMMMGGWFVATAIGNYLVAIIGYLWGDMQLWMVWSVLIVCCLLSALFIFSILKRLEKVC